MCEVKEVTMVLIKVYMRYVFEIGKHFCHSDFFLVFIKSYVLNFRNFLTTLTKYWLLHAHEWVCAQLYRSKSDCLSNNFVHFGDPLSSRRKKSRSWLERWKLRIKYRKLRVGGRRMSGGTFSPIERWIRFARSFSGFFLCKSHTKRGKWLCLIIRNFGFLNFTMLKGLRMGLWREKKMSWLPSRRLYHRFNSAPLPPRLR